jgi:hypothetical protein
VGWHALSAPDGADPLEGNRAEECCAGRRLLAGRPFLMSALAGRLTGMLVRLAIGSASYVLYGTAL